jgi:transcriptional regulator with XRE-family HTH domain
VHHEIEHQGGFFKSMDASDDTGKGVIAERLDKLFATMTPEGRPFSLRETADGINAKAGRKVVTFQYLAKLRSGEKRKPSHETLQAIASWFGVKTDYFSDDEVAAATDDQLRVLSVMQDAGVRRVAFRSAGLDQESLNLVAGILDQLRLGKGLPPAEPDDQDAEPSGDSEPKFRPPV